MIKQEKFKNRQDFIQGWYLPDDICDSLIKLFEDNKKLQHPGCMTYKKTYGVHKDLKDSTDIKISPARLDIPEINTYIRYLKHFAAQYYKIYPEVNFAKLYLREELHLQRYKPNQGFKAYHWERGGGEQGITRELVWMTYLNNVKNGGTEFKYQKLKTKAKKGLTIIWPAAYTHTHRGIVSKTETKYIITGWLNASNSG